MIVDLSKVLFIVLHAPKGVFNLGEIFSVAAIRLFCRDSVRDSLAGGWKVMFAYDYRSWHRILSIVEKSPGNFLLLGDGGVYDPEKGLFDLKAFSSENSHYFSRKSGSSMGLFGTIWNGLICPHLQYELSNDPDILHEFNLLFSHVDSTLVESVDLFDREPVASYRDLGEMLAEIKSQLLLELSDMDDSIVSFRNIVSLFSPLEKVLGTGGKQSHLKSPFKVYQEMMGFAKFSEDSSEKSNADTLYYLFDYAVSLATSQITHSLNMGFFEVKGHTLRSGGVRTKTVLDVLFGNQQVG